MERKSVEELVSVCLAMVRAVGEIRNPSINTVKTICELYLGAHMELTARGQAYRLDGDEQI